MFIHPCAFSNKILVYICLVVDYIWEFVVFRLFRLLEEIMGEKENKTLVFVETKRKCDELTRRMKRDGWPVLAIHGDKSQPERDWVLQGKYLPSIFARQINGLNCYLCVSLDCEISGYAMSCFV